MVEREEREAIEKERRSTNHREGILAQVKSKEGRRRKKVDAKFEEGRRLHEETLKERAKMSAIKDKMIDDLLDSGVNPNYLSEMRNVDVVKIQMR